MDAGWIFLGSVGMGLIGLFLYVLLRMASTEDRRARHAEKDLDPFADVTITR